MKKTILRVILYLMIIFIIISIINYYSSEIINNFKTFASWLYPKNEDKNGELFKIVLSILGASGILYSLYISLRRAKAIEKGLLKQSEALNLQSEQINLSRKSQISERFKNAIEHLGSDKEPIILGGISELHQIAKENQTDYSEIIFNILTGYIRSNAKKEKNINIIQTIIDFVFTKNKKRPYHNFKANLSYCNLIGIKLINKDLSLINLNYSKISHIENCNIENSQLNNTHFFCASIINVNFENVKIQNTYFYTCRFENVIFRNNIKYPTAFFMDCRLKKVRFMGLHLSDWQFIICSFEHCEFNNNEIISAKFCFSFFENTIFKDIKLFSRNDFRACLFKSVTFENIFVMDSNFRGLVNNHSFTRPYLSIIQELTGKKADITGINNQNSTFNRSDFTILSNEDVIEIKEIGNKIEKKIFPKKG